MSRKSVILLLVCFSLSFLGAAFHHHEEGTSPGNCPICSYVFHHSGSISQDLPQFSLSVSDVSFIPVERTLIDSSFRYHPYLNRAPPV